MLKSLHSFRLLTTAQVQRLHFVDGPHLSRIRRAQYVLKRLQELGLVVRLDRLIGGVRAGSSGFVYGLSAVGQTVLEVGGPAGGPRRRVWDTRPYFQDHMLAVAELYVRLRELERHDHMELLTFDGEPASWRHFTGSGGELVMVKPDAYVRVGFQEFERRAFVEVDLSTESLPTIERKCLRFIAHWRSGVEQQRHGVYPMVVWLVPDERRRQNIQRVIRRFTMEEAQLFTVALAADGPAFLSAPPAAGMDEHTNDRAPP
ncbi:replication-relaxation family protein [Lentzea sp. NPDC051838]|uniref:replication-relaxation family protein n=1 Tax=Lentzea sp. NPDC051838 TaxID=3154849 RepID=UPI00344AD9C6